MVSDLLAKSQFYWSSLEWVGNERGGEGETKEALSGHAGSSSRARGDRTVWQLLGEV